MALVTAGELPQLHATAGVGSTAGGRSNGASGRRSMVIISSTLRGLGEKPGFLAEGAALGGVIGAVHDAGVAVDHVPEGTDGAARGIKIVGG